MIQFDDYVKECNFIEKRLSKVRYNELKHFPGMEDVLNKLIPKIEQAALGENENNRQYLDYAIYLETAQAEDEEQKEVQRVIRNKLKEIIE